MPIVPDRASLNGSRVANGVCLVPHDPNDDIPFGPCASDIVIRTYNDLVQASRDGLVTQPDMRETTDTLMEAVGLLRGTNRPVLACFAKYSEPYATFTTDGETKRNILLFVQVWAITDSGIGRREEYENKCGFVGFASYGEILDWREVTFDQPYANSVNTPLQQVWLNIEEALLSMEED